MAFGAKTAWELNASGSDTLNGGGFDVGATFATDLAATVATSSAPVVTSASYNFITRDNGKYLWVGGGTNWVKGMYPITSTAGNAATLNAAIGAVVLYDANGRPTGTNTVAGIATVASPTGGTWGVDYSRGATAGVTFTDLVIDATTNTKFTSAASPVGPNYIGNILQITSTSPWVPGWKEILSVSGTVATCDVALGTTGLTSGHGGLGGALATPGIFASLTIAGNIGFLLAPGTFTTSSVSNNVANGRCSPTAGTSSTVETMMIGYNTNRYIDNSDATRPLMRVGVNAAICIFPGNYTYIRNINFDNPGAFTSAYAVQFNGSYVSVENCSASAIGNGFSTNGNSSQHMVNIYCTGCGTSFNMDSGSHLDACVSVGHTVAGFVLSVNFCSLIDCYAVGGASPGFQIGGNSHQLSGCVAANNAGATVDGFQGTGANLVTLINCISYGNGRFGITNGGTASENWRIINCGLGANVTAPVDTTLSAVCQQGTLTLTASPFTNSGGGDYSLNSTAGGGVLLKAAGYPASYQGLSTNNYLDVGAAQHQAAAAGALVASDFTGGFNG